jgi:hypothetical protein
MQGERAESTRVAAGGSEAPMSPADPNSAELASVNSKREFGCVAPGDTESHVRVRNENECSSCEYLRG